MGSSIRAAQAIARGTAMGFALFSSVALADPSPALDRISLWLGGDYVDTQVSLNAATHDAAASTGNVDLTDGHEFIGRARADLLFFDTQGLTLDYYKVDRSTAQSLDSDFSYDGVDYPIHSTLISKFDFSAASASYHWWVGSGADVFGLGLGATWYKAQLGLSATLDEIGQSQNGEASWSASAVAPTLTLAYKHAFSDQLRLYLDASGVKKNGGKLAGHIYDARLGLEWFPWTNIGLGAEYGITRVHLVRERDIYDANLDIDLGGPALYARFRF